MSCFAGPGEDKSIDQHFFDARPTVSPTTRLCLINRIDGSVSRLEGWPGPALRESASAAGYDGKAALGKKGDVSVLVFDSTGGHIFIFSVFLSAHRCAPRADPFCFFPPRTFHCQDPRSNKAPRSRAGVLLLEC